MAEILGYATFSVNSLDEITSISGVMIDSKKGERISTFISNRDVAAGLNPNFIAKMIMLRQQNVFSYTINRIQHRDGTSTIHMIHGRYTVNGGDFFNQYLYGGVENENSVVS